MAKSLWVNTAVLLDNKIFFMTDEEGYPGGINLDSGKVVFFQNVPQRIVGRRAFEMQLFNVKNDIYIVSNKGDYAYKYCYTNNWFEDIFLEENIVDDTIETCAGKCMFKEKMFLFTRTGFLVSLDYETKTMFKKKVINDGQILWATSREEIVWLLVGNNMDLYTYNLKNDECRLFDKNILERFVTKSKSWIPVHHMIIDGGRIIIHDSANIFVYDINNKNISCISLFGDNGSRLILTNNSIIVPPYHGDKYIYINKNTGKVVKEEIIMEDVIEKQNNKAESITGEIVEDTENYYFPILSSRTKYFAVNKENENIEIRKLSIDIENKSDLVKNLINKTNFVIESENKTIKDFVCAI